jgi:TATA-binding protein-associated factor Taf7
MNWTQIIVAIVATGVLSTIISVISNRRRTRVETDSQSLRNMKEVYSILREEYEKYRTKAEMEYKRYDDKIERLEKETSLLEDKMHEMEAIIEEFRRCSFYIEKGKCPVKKRKFIIHNS